MSEQTPNLEGLMKQAQAMQGKMQEAQQELAKLEVSGEAGGGLVKVVITGRHDIRRVSIDDSLMDEDEKDVLEDLIAAAVNDAVRKVEKAAQEKMVQLTKELGLPTDLGGAGGAGGMGGMGGGAGGMGGFGGGSNPYGGGALK